MQGFCCDNFIFIHLLKEFLFLSTYEDTSCDKKLHFDVKKIYDFHNLLAYCFIFA